MIATVTRRPIFMALLPLVGIGLTGLLTAPVSAQWTQWGGPDQDWKCDSKKIADKWPEGGPKTLWVRDLGEGYSGVMVDEGNLYTMYRSEDKARVICLKADTGATVWEFDYEEDPDEKHQHQFGDGPRGTPLIDANQVYTIGVRGIMHCLDKKTGKPLWTHDLWKEFKGNVLQHGYASSAIAYKDTVIVLVGGEGAGMVAFNKTDGSLAWKKHDFGNSYSTPKLISVDGQDQLLCYMAKALVSIDPNNGDEFWNYEIGNQWGQNICLPVWNDDDNTLFLSTMDAGSRGLKLTRSGGKTEVEEIWSTRKIQLYHVTAIGVGDYVYASSGAGMGKVCFFACLNRKTGKIAWRKRGFAKATTLYADGKFIILDEDGKLALVKATPDKDGFEILSEVEDVLEGSAWTVPTIVGKRLFLRDAKKIMALDLG